MTPEQAKILGQMLKARRAELSLSSHRLAELADIDQATVVRLEAGSIAAPRPDKLSRIAKVLALSGADIFALADYTVPQDLPTLKPYLRSKYRDMPSEDVEKIEAYVARLAKKHGLQVSEPAPGEDETP
ncbi:MAG: helix-turn-helix domain-containing protein [Actinobacteria bacterium]|nr:helix-turn-helix domain-containing protein [Actinomycetota bacterium]